MPTWQELVDLWYTIPFQSEELQEGIRAYSKGPDVVRVLKVKLQHSAELFLALRVASCLNEDHKKALFAELFFWTTVMKGASSIAGEIIKSLPKEWVMLHLQNEIEKYLGADATYEEYRMIVQFTDGYAPEIARDIVRRALSHPDEYIKEVGEDFNYLLDDEQN